jgi:hypothetical protein
LFPNWVNSLIPFPFKLCNNKVAPEILFSVGSAHNYLRSLAVVDKNNIGIVAMSQGGFGPATAAAQAIPDGYKSIFFHGAS